jgi:hypothetical protein
MDGSLAFENADVQQRRCIQRKRAEDETREGPYDCCVS